MMTLDDAQNHSLLTKTNGSPLENIEFYTIENIYNKIQNKHKILFQLPKIAELQEAEKLAFIVLFSWPSVRNIYERYTLANADYGGSKSFRKFWVISELFPQNHNYAVSWLMNAEK